MVNEDYRTIFLITVFETCDETADEYHADTGDRRSVGFRPTFELAERVMETNMCDIWETCYDYAVIEEIGCELYPDYQRRWFYKYNKELNKYELIDEPMCFRNYCNIGEIG